MARARRAPARPGHARDRRGSQASWSWLGTARFAPSRAATRCATPLPNPHTASTNMAARVILHRAGGASRAAELTLREAHDGGGGASAGRTRGLHRLSRQVELTAARQASQYNKVNESQEIDTRVQDGCRCDDIPRLLAGSLAAGGSWYRPGCVRACRWCKMRCTDWAAVYPQEQQCEMGARWVQDA